MNTINDYINIAKNELSGIATSLDEENMKKYNADIQVGDYVRLSGVTYPATARVFAKDNISLTVYTTGYKQPARKIHIKGRMFTAKTVKLKSYADELMIARCVLKSVQGKDVACVYVGSEPYAMYIKEVLSDAVILECASTRLCVPILAIDHIITKSGNMIMVRKPTREDILKWCRENAPEALKDLSDDDLFNAMKDAYDIAHS